MNKMMLKTVLGLALFATPLLPGCGSDDTSGTTTTTNPPSTTTSGSAFMRLAQLSPNAPAADFCMQLGTAAFTGPTMKNLGLTTGLAYAQVSRYLTIPQGTYTIRLVDPKAADCNTALAGFQDIVTPAMNTGTYSTVAAIGLVNGSPAFQMKHYVDDFTSVSSALAAFRFIQASPGTPPVDVGVLVAPVPGSSTALFTPVFKGVTFASTGSGAGVDANGYLAAPPLSNVTLSARASGTSLDALVVPGVSLAAGSTATGFGIGIIGSATTPLKVLLCGDNAPPTGNLSTCRIAP